MNESASDATQPTSPASSAAPIDPRTQQALGRIRTALSRRNGDEAVRFFKDASLHGFIPGDDNVLAWLHQTLGNDMTEKLLSAHAKLPCFYCNKGLVTCEHCQGRGHDEDGMLCPECLALGIDGCDFCGASGWFTINHVPLPFRLSVILHRVVAAGKEAEIVLGSPIPTVSTDHMTEARKLAAKALLQVNRLLGILENMTVAAHQMKSPQSESAETAHKAIAACEILAPRLKERACRLLAILAEAAKTEAASASRTAARRLAERRAGFCGRLAASGDFSDTMLRHPLLFQSDASEPSLADTESAPEDVPGA